MITSRFCHLLQPQTTVSNAVSQLRHSLPLHADARDEPPPVARKPTLDATQRQLARQIERTQNACVAVALEPEMWSPPPKRARTRRTSSKPVATRTLATISEKAKRQLFFTP